MKRLLPLLVTVLLVGCNAQDAYRQLINLNPDSEVKVVPGEHYMFLVRRPNGQVDYVNYNGCRDDDYAKDTIKYTTVFKEQK